jgi:hypothetical protein
VTEPLVRVGFARHQAEAELMEGLLRENGIRALVRRTGGADVPDYLAAGPREILVAASDAELAREVLGTPAPEQPVAGAREAPAWLKPLAVAVAVAIVALLAAGIIAAF